MWRWMGLVGLVGCGGVAAGTPLNELDADDWAQLCEEATQDTQPITADCGVFQVDLPAYSAADCESDASFLTQTCTAVVGDWQTCLQGSQATDPCDPQPPSACALVADCSSI